MSIPTMNVVPTEEKADCLRLLSLVIDGGSEVLLHQFDQRVPPADLSNKLGETDIYKKLSDLRKRKVLNDDQWNQLYPQIGNSSSKHFDLTLLTLLLRYICGLDENSSAWKKKPPRTDLSVEADIARLKTTRNKMSHMKKLSLTKYEFQTKWDKTEQVIIRLGRDIPDLSENIQKLKHANIDPSKEKEYQEKLKEYEEMERNFKADVEEVKISLTKVDKEIEVIKSQSQSMQSVVKEQGEELGELSRKQDKLEKTFYEKTRFDEKEIEDLTSKQSNLEQSIEQIKQIDIKTIYERLQQSDIKVDDIHETVSKHVKQDDCEVTRLEKRTKLHIDESERQNVFVSTNAHKQAKNILEKTGWVILTGQPGEGKTTMAVELLREMQQFHTCVKLNKPKDWENIDFDRYPGIVILIDDIFGGGALSDRLLTKWSCYLPDIYKAVQKKKIQVIITTRHYILQEARDQMHRLHLFKDENIIYISSYDLTQVEKTEILAAHLKNLDREITPGLIDDCVRAYDESFKYLDWNYNLRNHVFPGGALSEYLRIGKFEEFKSTTGFPEVVSLFVEHDHLFILGSKFFSKPLIFFKQCMNDLYLEPEKFLALLLVWTMPKQELRLIDLDPPIVSFELRETASKFGFVLEGQIMRAVRRFLEYHKGGFLVFESKRGVYKFCHNTVKDMVGLVGAKDYPIAAIEYASIDFLLQYVTIDRRKSQDGFHIFIEEYRYAQFINVLWNILLSKERTDPFGNRLNESHFEKHIFGFLFSLEGGSLKNLSILKHECFHDEEFVHLFLENENGLAFSRSQGFFIHEFGYYGLGLPKKMIPVYVPSLALLYGNQVILKYYLQNMIPRGAKLSDNFYYIHTLLAIHKGLLPTVELLLRHGSSVNEDAIYIAARKGDVSILRFLLMNKRKNYEPKTNVFNGNNPLIAAAKAGSEDCIKALLKDGSDVNYKNIKGWTALDKGILYGKTEACKILLQLGASVNNKIGKFKRTPLHRCADLGHTRIAELLIQYGASVNVRDNKGHFPIHCAAFGGHHDIVDLLLKADCGSAKQIRYRLTYGKKSVLSGADLYHIAVYKQRLNVIKVLLKNKLNPNVRDFYGRTPFYRAVYEGSFTVNELLSFFDQQRAENNSMPSLDLNMADNNGYTPLHAAIHKRNGYVVNKICPYVNVNAQDKHGKTPLHTACENLDLHTFTTLIKDFRADVRMVTKQGLCIFDILDNKSRNRNFYEIWKRNRRGQLHEIVHKEPRWIDFLEVVKTVDEEFANNWKDLIKQSTVNKN